MHYLFKNNDFFRYETRLNFLPYKFLLCMVFQYYYIIHDSD